MARKKEETLDFEAALEQLNGIVEEMEHGGLTLEAALKNFETGICLVRQCQDTIKAAEQKIQILAEQSTESMLLPFDISEDE